MSTNSPLINNVALDGLIGATSREFAKELLDMFREVNRQALADLSSAIDRDDFAEARRIAHKLRSAGNLGAARFSDLARQLEDLPSDTASDAYRALCGQLDATYVDTHCELEKTLGAPS